MKKLILIIAAIALVGCEVKPAKYERLTEFSALPQELSDCKIFRLTTQYESGGSPYSITVVRCPNSSTTTQSDGKLPQTVTVIEK